ncbi:MAG: hypothetical protein R3A49_04230 [Acidimicrobiia bacterium]
MADSGDEERGGPGVGETDRPDPPVELASFAAELREGWRSEHEGFAAEAEVAWRHRLSLNDVLAAHRRRGDVLAVEVLERTFTGHVVAVGADLLALHTTDGRVDIRTAFRHDESEATRAPLVVRLVQRGTRGDGRTPTEDDLGFRSRLLELEARREPVVVGALGLSEEPVGPVAIGADHLKVGGDSHVLLPLVSVAYVRLVDQPF